MKGRASRHTDLLRRVSLILLSVVGLCSLALANGSAFAAGEPLVSPVFNLPGKTASSNYDLEFTSLTSSLTPTVTRPEDVPDNWKSLHYSTSSCCAYDLKYPDNWVVVTQGDSLIDFGRSTIRSADGAYILVHALALRGGVTYDTAYQNELAYLTNPSTQHQVVNDRSVLLVSGVAKEDSYPSEVGYRVTIAFWHVGDVMYEISLREPANADDGTILATVLSTFIPMGGSLQPIPSASVAPYAGAPTGTFLSSSQPVVDCAITVPCPFNGAVCSNPMSNGWCSTLVSAGSWSGVDVYSNGNNLNNACTSTFGCKYQCVELAQRYSNWRFGTAGIWPNVQGARDMYDHPLSPWVPYPNGGSVPPSVGDLVIFDRAASNGYAGHVSVVWEFNQAHTQVHVVEENWSSTGEVWLPISGNTILDRGSVPVVGWLHPNGAPPTNTPTRTPTSPPNPTNTPTRTPTPDPNGAWTLTSPSYNVQPNQQVQVSVQLHSNTYTFLTTNSLLDSLDSQRYGAYQFQPLESNVYPGQSYTFNRPDMFTMTSPSQPGTYTVRWQMSVGGSHMGPISTVTLIVGQPPPTPTTVPPGTWHVQAYPNQSLSGSPCYEADETIGSYVFKDWGWSQPPGGSCPAEHWSARLVKQVTFSGGNYSFHCSHDDGCRVYIDGTLRIDAWWDGTGGHDWGGNISAGNHEVKVEFYNDTGLARVEVWWRGPGALPNNDPGDPSQWYVDYYGIHAIWETSALGLQDGSGFVSHDWRGQGNSPGFGLPAQNWAARFARTVTLPCGTYRFTVTADDGARLEVNGQALFDFGGGPPGTHYADVSLPGGDVPITLFYYQAGGDAYVSMDWQLLSACPTATPAPVPPTASFDAWPQSGDAPLTVSMHDISTGDITDCSWDYGDGTTGTSCDGYHDHVYAAAGSYTVSLTVTGPGGSDSMTRSDYINITVPSTNTPTDTPTDTPLPTQTPGGPTATTVPTNTVTHAPTHTPTDTPIPGVTATTTACPIQFTDVPEGSTFYAFVRCLACGGIINGYADGTFKPNANVTRGQLSKIVSNSAGFNEPQPDQMFQDVPLGSTFQLYIGRLASRGYINGYPCGGVGEPCGSGNLPYFRPNANSTRGQISKIVSNAEGFSDPASGQQFQDVAVNSTFYVFIYRLAHHGVMSGYPCGSIPSEPCVPPGNLPYFRPNANATRGQTSKIVANTFYPDCETPLER